MRKKPADHIPLVLPSKPTQSISISERQTFSNAEAKTELVRIGKILEGDDGKTYVSSFAIHIYKTSAQFTDEYLIASQSTGILSLPEHVALEAIKELSRQIMIRYGHKPPAKLNDVPEAQTQNI